MNQMVYSAEEASRMLSISKSTLLRLTKAQKLPSVRISTGRVGWEHSALLRFLDSCRSLQSN
jgi:excisionase family DNA binding protein